MKNQKNKHTAPAEVLQRMTYTLAEAAFVLGYSQRTVSRWITVGKIEALPEGRHKKISRSKLHRFIDTGVWEEGK